MSYKIRLIVSVTLLFLSLNIFSQKENYPSKTLNITELLNYSNMSNLEFESNIKKDYNLKKAVVQNRFVFEYNNEYSPKTAINFNVYKKNDFLVFSYFYANPELSPLRNLKREIEDLIKEDIVKYMGDNGSGEMWGFLYEDIEYYIVIEVKGYDSAVAQTLKFGHY